MWAAITNIIIGLFVMIAPAVFHFNKTIANHYHIVGPIVVTFAIVSLWEVNHSARYFNVPAGLWLLIAPFLFHFQPATATWMAVICGLLIIVLSFAKRKIKGQYGGGWRSLFQKHPAHMQ
ncbi:vitamin K epoxide reductase [Ilyomonas limi]|uniref:Vitamin K epoxide reductase n=1 Tax=Ilyomonas limi TaxID=2575867 RepID=A0A4U3L2G9_9BACT|nr:SPW repeat protein [Ilyomonas limi]TKK69215.1 vitamin K epoxide reductase [Ilyomonas limi]